MPLYHFVCTGCGEKSRRILSPEASRTPDPCGLCAKPLERAPTGVSCRVMETVDNGAMTRSVERLSDAEAMLRERNEATKKQQTGE